MNALHRLVSLAIVPALCAPLAAQTTKVVSVSAFGGGPNGFSEYPTVSGDGRFVAFVSYSDNLVTGDTNSRPDVFVRDVLNATTVRVSVDPAGGNSNNYNFRPLISRDGRFVAFESLATNIVAGDLNVDRDVFVRDLLTNTTVRASVSTSGAEGTGDAVLGSLSGDGRFVGFSSGSSNLVAGDTNSNTDVFVRDVLTRQTSRVSISTSGIQGNNESYGGSVSADGRYVAFYSWATNLVAGDTNAKPDLFVRDTLAGITTRVNLSASGAQDNGGVSSDAFLSDDGHLVVFKSYGTNFVTGDTNGFADVFERNLLTGEIQRVNVDNSGGQANDNCYLGGISADGRSVVWFSDATTLVPGDTNNKPDVFVRDCVTAVTSRVSLGAGYTQANDSSSDAGISSDGRFVAFGSYATNLDPADISTIQDVFLRDRGLATVTAFCFGDGTQAQCPCANNGAPGHGCENSAATGGAQLSVLGFAGDPNLATLEATGIVPGALTIFVQSNALLARTTFGDGVRCFGGVLTRMYVANAVGDTAHAPTPGSLPLGSQSALLGDPIMTGTSRWYQAWYRDAVLSFCAAPLGDASNLSSGVRVDW